MRDNLRPLAAFVAVALIAASLLVLTAVGQASATRPILLVCDGAYADRTVHSVIVPHGASCELRNVTVLHNVAALRGAVDVKVLDSTVGGNVIVKRATGLVHVGQSDCRFDPEVRGNVIIRRSHDVLVCYVTGHNIMVNRNDGRVTVRDNVAHRIDVSHNRAYTSGRTGHARPDAIRVLRNEARQHIHLKHNHPSRPIITRGNTPGAKVWQ